MKKLVLFIICVIFSAATAQDPNKDGNSPPQKPSPNEPNAAVRQRNLREKLTKEYAPRKMTDAEIQERAARAKQHNEQLKSFENQLAKEFEKHNQRITTLNRIKQLAGENGQIGKVKKADELINLENSRHKKKITQLHSRPAAPPVKSGQTQQTK